MATTNGTATHDDPQNIRDRAIEYAVARTTVAVRFFRDNVPGVGVGRVLAVTTRHIVLLGGSRETVITLSSVTELVALDGTLKGEVGP